MAPEELEQKLLIKKLGPEMIPACDAGAGPIAFVAGLPASQCTTRSTGEKTRGGWITKGWQVQDKGSPDHGTEEKTYQTQEERRAAHVQHS